jgi:hypothetical protein
MNVRVVLQVLARGMEHADEADLGAEMLRIGGDSAQRFCGGPEQNRIDLVLESDFRGRCRQGEDDMEIGHRQQLGLPLGQPGSARRSLTFRAMAVATRVVGNTNEVALRAAFNVTSERRRAARLDRCHDAPIRATEMTGMGHPIGLAMAAEDVRHLERGHDRRASFSLASRSPCPAGRMG